MPNPVTLQEVGLAIYGPHWQGPLTSALNVDERTFRRWVGGTPVPPGVVDDVLQLWKERMSEATAIMDRLGTSGFVTQQDMEQARGFQTQVHSGPRKPGHFGKR
jgi:hypothetical protein